jgi:hypothetical protein
METGLSALGEKDAGRLAHMAARAKEREVSRLLLRSTQGWNRRSGRLAKEEQGGRLFNVGRGGCMKEQEVEGCGGTTERV